MERSERVCESSLDQCCLTHEPWNCTLSHNSFFSAPYLQPDMQRFEVHSERIGRRIKNWRLLSVIRVTGKRSRVWHSLLEEFILVVLINVSKHQSVTSQLCSKKVAKEEREDIFWPEFCLKQLWFPRNHRQTAAVLLISLFLSPGSEKWRSGPFCATVSTSK